MRVIRSNANTVQKMCQRGMLAVKLAILAPAHFITCDSVLTIYEAENSASCLLYHFVIYVVIKVKTSAYNFKIHMCINLTPVTVTPFFLILILDETFEHIVKLNNV